MGMDYNAYLGYGVKIFDKSLSEGLQDFSAVLSEKLAIIDSGNGYADIDGVSTMHTFVCIEESVQATCDEDPMTSPLKKGALVVDPNWHIMLMDFCNEYKITNPQIGWWLCCSVT